MSCAGAMRARQVFHDEADHQGLIDGIARTVSPFGWEISSFVLMPNHFHLFLRTPQPSLSRGMRYRAKVGQAGRHQPSAARPLSAVDPVKIQ